MDRDDARHTSRQVTRLTQAEAEAVVAPFGVEASVSWDERHGCHRIEPGPTMTMDGLDALRGGIRGAYAVLDHTTLAGRDLMEALEAGFPPRDAGDDDPLEPMPG